MDIIEIGLLLTSSSITNRSKPPYCMLAAAFG